MIKKLREMARNSSKAEMNEKLVGKSGSFGRFKQNNTTRDKKNSSGSDDEQERSFGRRRDERHETFTHAQSANG